METEKIGLSLFTVDMYIPIFESTDEEVRYLFFFMSSVLSPCSLNVREEVRKDLDGNHRVGSGRSVLRSSGQRPL